MALKATTRAFLLLNHICPFRSTLIFESINPIIKAVVIINPFAYPIPGGKANSNKNSAPEPQSHEEDAGGKSQNNTHGLASVLLP
jgi:hypothetical protein